MNHIITLQASTYGVLELDGKTLGIIGVAAVTLLAISIGLYMVESAFGLIAQLISFVFTAMLIVTMLTTADYSSSGDGTGIFAVVVAVVGFAAMLVGPPFLGKFFKDWVESW